MYIFFRFKKNVAFWFLGAFLMVLTSGTNAFAHKVNIFAYVEGDLVYTESYFPDGRKVEKGTVEVYDSHKNKLLTGVTDKKGIFNFRPPKKDDLKIVIIAGMGHKNSYLLSADELPDTIFTGETHPPLLINNPKDTLPAKDSTQKTSKEGLQIPGEKRIVPKKGSIPQHDILKQQINFKELKNIIDQSLDQKLQPIMRELAKAKHKEKISFTEIFGGIGYIFGIIGIILYFTKKSPQ